jgi:quercetin dioxygenase-like cupin family protein
MFIANERTGTPGHDALHAENGRVVSLVPKTARGGSIAVVALDHGKLEVAASGEVALVVLSGQGAAQLGGQNIDLAALSCFFASEPVTVTGNLRLLVIMGNKGHATSRLLNIPQVEDHPFHMPEQGFYHLSARWLVDGGIGAEALVVGQSTFTQQGSAHELHRHDHAEEFFFLLEGHGHHLTEEAAHPMTQGDIVFVPQQEWHGFRNTGSGPVRAIFGYFGVNSLETSGYELHLRTIALAEGARA